jgi:hypothetical protein
MAQSLKSSSRTSPVSDRPSSAFSGTGMPVARTQGCTVCVEASHEDQNQCMMESLICLWQNKARTMAGRWP